MNKENSTSNSYKIQRGDTLSDISRMFNIPIEELIKHNKIADPNLIYAGDTLTLPIGIDKYKIQRGDNLSSISRKFGIPMKQLIALNQIQNPNSIRTGDLLRIPIKGVMGPGVTIVGSKTTKTSDALPINIPPVPRDNTYVNTPIIYTDPNSLTNPKTNPKTNAVIGQMNFNTTPIRGFTATDKSSRYAGPVVRNPAPKPVPNRQTPKNLKPRTSITPISADNTRTNIPIIYNDSLRVDMSKVLDRLYNPQNYVTKRK